MTVRYRTRGIVLKKNDRGESDQILTFYTKEFGKLEILGKAIRKIKSKLRSGAELFYLSEIEFIQGKAYKTLTDAILIEKFKNPRDDLKKLKIAYQVSETLDTLVDKQEKDEKIFDLLEEIFRKLDNCKIENSLEIGNWKLKIIYCYFLWNLLSALGYQVDFYHCVICQKKLSPQNLYFSLEEGGIICGDCCRKTKKCGAIAPEAIKIIRLFLKRDWAVLEKLKISEQYLNQLDLISRQYLSYYKSGIIV